jgi:hypothetical protein
MSSIRDMEGHCQKIWTGQQDRAILSGSMMWDMRLRRNCFFFHGRRDISAVATEADIVRTLPEVQQFYLLE